MPVMPWSNLLSVGVRDIDDQHRVLVDILNRLGDVVMGDVTEWNEKAVLADLLQYTAQHFGFEERLMRKAGYAGVDAHVREHREFILQIKAMTERFNSGDLPDAEELLVFVREWLTTHILGTDRALAQALNAQGIR